MSVSRLPKFMPADGSIPPQSKFACRTCKEWFASTCGKTNHLKKHPDHEMYSTLTGKDQDTPNRPYRKAHVLGTNGHALLGATARDLLLDYVLGKAKEELNAELDSMFRNLKSQPIPTEKGTRKTYVAR
jgi:hypothetical protein